MAGAAPRPKTAMTTEDAAKKQQDAPREKNITDQKFIDEVLKAHNSYRSKHDARALLLDKDLCQVAQAFATKLAKQGENFQYSGNGFGENIFFTTEGPVSGKMPVDAWYSESRRYDWNKLEKQQGTSHFTQVIWKGSQKLGVAMATSKYGIYVVANYLPPGNVVGKYPMNISSPANKKKPT